MRRARKRMELVRPGESRRRREGASDETFLSRRTFVFKGLMLGGFTALAGKLWKMQVVDAHLYDGQVAGTVDRFESLPAARGLVVDRNGVVLANNRAAWTVSVVPAQLPTDASQLQSIRDQLVNVLALPEMLVVRRDELPLGSEQYVLRDLATLIGADPGQLTGNVLHPADGANTVVVQRTVAPADVARLTQAAKRLPGVHVENTIDYLLEVNAGSPTAVPLKKDVARGVALNLKANALYLPGVQVTDTTLIRQYPAGPDFAHILGYVGPISEQEYQASLSPNGTGPYLPTDDVGRGGIEQALEAELRGTRGGRWVQTDANGVVISTIPGRQLDPTPGPTAVLTIDHNFQIAVAQALQAGIDAANAAAKKAPVPAPDSGSTTSPAPNVGAGAVVAIDPQTGEILALVSLPTFDNQLFIDGISDQQYQAYLNNPFKPLTDRSIAGEFPPGSTIKPFYASAALNEGTINTSTTFTCAGEIRVPVVGNESGGNFYKCWIYPGHHGPMAVVQAIAQSCDCFFYNVGAPGQQIPGTNQILHYYNPGDPYPHNFQGLGIDKMDQYLDDFGFGKPSGIQMPGEASGLVPTPKWLFQSPLHAYWSVGDTIITSIGQGHLLVTPLQLATATAAVANGGTYHQPTLVKELRGAGGQVVKTFNSAARPVSVAPAHVDVVRSGMRLEVAEPTGTAHGKFVKTPSSIQVSGKTGTAQYGPNNQWSHAWYTCFAPYDTPRIAVAVVIEGGGEGATFAVPVADAVLAAYFANPKAWA
ncbi:MAG TPA: penicillin-binding protein 2 [Thermomicrobiaceae bacterium]|nr:penicillin-binding protein 2 [Thermomicrobiaceae bacterium]